MTERITRIKLEVHVGKARTIGEPLTVLEKILLQRYQPGLVEKIESGQLWQSH